jgi:methyl-accepting chemotaxis protein
MEVVMIGFRNLKISRKITLLIGASLIISVVVAFFGFRGMMNLKSDEYDLEKNHIPIFKYLGRLSESLAALQRAERSLFIPEYMNDPKEVEHQKQNIAKYTNIADESIKEYHNVDLEDFEAKAWNDFLVLWYKWKAMNDKVVQLSLNNKRSEAMELSTGDARLALRETENALNALAKLNDEEANKQLVIADNDTVSTRNSLLIVFSFGIMLIVGVGYYISVSITRPMHQAANSLFNIARGDFSEFR